MKTLYEAGSRHKRTSPAYRPSPAHMNSPLVYSGCPINIRDWYWTNTVDSSSHTITAKVIIECGASVRDELFPDSVPLLQIAKVKGDNIMIDIIEQKIQEEEEVIRHVESFTKAIQMVLKCVALMPDLILHMV